MGDSAGGGQPRGGGLLFRADGRRFGESRFAAVAQPSMIIQQTSDSGCQPVGCVKDGDAGLFQHIQTRGLFTAAGPEERQGLFLGQVTLGDDLFRLGVAAGAGHHQRAHRRVVDHVLHDLRKRLAIGEAGDVGRVGRPPESLQNAVDSVSGGSAKFR